MYRQYKAPMLGGLRAPRYIGYGIDVLARTSMNAQQMNSLSPSLMNSLSPSLSLAALNAIAPKPPPPPPAPVAAPLSIAPPVINPMCVATNPATPYYYAGRGCIDGQEYQVVSMAYAMAAAAAAAKPVQTGPWTRSGYVMPSAPVEDDSSFVMARGTGGKSSGGGGGSSSGGSSSGSTKETVETCTQKGLYLSFNAPVCVSVTEMDNNCAKELQGSHYDMSVDACVKSSGKAGSGTGAKTGTTPGTLPGTPGATAGTKANANTAMIAGAAALAALLLLR